MGCFAWGVCVFVFMLKQHQGPCLVKFSTSGHDDFLTQPGGAHISLTVLTFNRHSVPPLGDTIGSHQTSSGSGKGQREDGAWRGARRPRQEPKPGDDDVSRREREPHGGRPQAQSPGYFRGHSGGEGGANAALCGEDRNNSL